MLHCPRHYEINDLNFLKSNPNQLYDIKVQFNHEYGVNTEANYYNYKNPPNMFQL